ncbi:MAG: FAD-dependent oxidoreductase [Vicinamibacterales bacterium]
MTAPAVRPSATAFGRRRFLRLSALAAGPLLTSFGCRQPSPSLAPVVVVGAGLAGLMAADVLRKAGRQVVVLEARGYPGGRVRTIREPFDEGLFAEAGAIRIAPSHQIVIRLAKQFGLDLVPFDSSNGSSLITVGTRRIRTDALSRTTLPLELKADERGLGQGALLERYVGDLPNDLADLAPTAASYARWEAFDRLTWHEWLRSRGASPGAVRLMTLGGDSSELSALYVLRQFALLRGTTQFYKLQGGMDQLPRAMAGALGDRVRYNAAVVRLDQADAETPARTVRVDYVENDQTRSLRASRVILAIPFSTLRQIDVRPALSPNRARVINELPYFPATRLLLQSRTRFWHASGLSGYARTDQPAEIWDCTYDAPAAPGILGATVGGALGRSMLEMSEDQCIQLGWDLVAATFPDIRAGFVKGVALRWALEPWSRGAFAVFHPGQMTSMMPGISRPEGRLHFAGEHTSSWMGWMEGALESGERAAREVLSQ